MLARSTVDGPTAGSRFEVIEYTWGGGRDKERTTHRGRARLRLLSPRGSERGSDSPFDAQSQAPRLRLVAVARS